MLGSSITEKGANLASPSQLLLLCFCANHSTLCNGRKILNILMKINIRWTLPESSFQNWVTGTTMCHYTPGTSDHFWNYLRTLHLHIVTKASLKPHKDRLLTWVCQGLKSEGLIWCAQCPSSLYLFSASWSLILGWAGYYGPALVFHCGKPAWRDRLNEANGLYILNEAFWVYISHE